MVSAQTLKDAIRLTVNEQYEEATGTFKALLQKEPANATNYYYFGKNYIQQEELDSARAIFQKGTEVDAKNPLNFIGLGEVLLNEAKISESKTKYDKAVKSYNDLKQITTAQQTKPRKCALQWRWPAPILKKQKPKANRKRLK
jgi:tetratricopeptide (TPR) repeat protein